MAGASLSPRQDVHRAAAMTDGSEGELRKCNANYTPLTPLVFLERAATVYGDRTCIIYGGMRRTWSQTWERCARVASCLLDDLGLRRGDVVSVLAPNVPALYELHFAIPMAGCIINSINTRLNAATISSILSHSSASILLVDHRLLSLATDALSLLRASSASPPPPLIVINDDENGEHQHRNNMKGVIGSYEEMVWKAGNSRVGDMYRGVRPADEWESISLNYTSGTTSAPKGVVYSHRGAYLSSLSMLLLWNMPCNPAPVYLWTLPMFHCNGWTFTWALAARGATSVCMRTADPSQILRAIAIHGVSHMCCAPVVFSMLLDDKHTSTLPHTVSVITGGAPPPPAVVQRAEAIGFNVTHAYGLTEATGPALVCEWRTEWEGLQSERKAALKGRQGVNVLSVDSMEVMTIAPSSSSSSSGSNARLVPVARDGKSMGEIMLRGSSVMKGYLGDSKSTGEAFDGGWFHTGDVAVVHPDGYVEIKDRAKDVIISGGENISSVQVESVLYGHPSVVEAAVVAMPHPHWGETPCAFVKPKEKEGSQVLLSESDIINFCRERLPHYMAPTRVVFCSELPKSNGKIQKHLLRERAKSPAAPKTANRTSRKIAYTRQQQHDDNDEYAVMARSRL